ncbi:ATP-grasp fold amidoligase family protein [Clostridium perfringens]|uniref:ATP-grasp fold amidoligase family protein n=1 Tax=Clostridium perfringens TaxID=1502 RepID=UPI000E17E5E0|nr:ATP-grasp fold amidoligase family protein [Clostridium perfringens]MDU6351449.1 ATP-grasp fold amidoligase family protein [Clostridium perfringens]SUY38498.1 glycosyltransferase [Clostridium perfringens]
MNYKKLIKSQKLRLKILDLLQFIDDKNMLKIQYRIKTGRRLNLDRPERYTEKLQWYKLNYKDPIMKKCSDKYEVREYVKNKGLEHILNDIYGVFDNELEIDFQKLPEQFVLKTTNGAGGNNIIICNDKKRLNEDKCKKMLKSWLGEKRKDYGREGVYSGVKPKIIAEKLLPRDENNDLPDYKFFCFNGKVECLYTMIDYVDNHENGKLGFYDCEFKRIPYNRLDFKRIEKELKKPENFEDMILIAETLSKDFPHVRVDLYNINGKIIFGELTFFTGSGYMKFSPDEFDFILGKKFNIFEK